MAKYSKSHREKVHEEMHEMKRRQAQERTVW